MGQCPMPDQSAGDDGPTAWEAGTEFLVLTSAQPGPAGSEPVDGRLLSPLSPSPSFFQINLLKRKKSAEPKTGILWDVAVERRAGEGWIVGARCGDRLWVDLSTVPGVGDNGDRVQPPVRIHPFNTCH